VTRFRDRYPGVRLSVLSARLDQLLEHLERRRVEMALLWDYEWSRISEPDLVLRTVLDDPTALVVSASHRLAHRRSVPMEELADESWITRADAHPVADVLSRSALDAGFEPTVAFEANDYQEAQAMVAVGLGVALAPRLALMNLRDDVRVLSLGSAAPTRRILLARLADRRPTPAEVAMSAVLAEVARSTALSPRSRRPPS
jgi:DNA-binding transcriptional LysR family regulator